MTPHLEEDLKIKTFRHYKELAEDKDVVATLAQQLSRVGLLFSTISEEQANYSYAPGKWTIKQVLGHMIDTERIMAFRAFCFSRGEKRGLPSFDKSAYTSNANFNNRTLADLLYEYTLVREANLVLFSSFSDEMLCRVGNINGKYIAVKDILYQIAGHELHHLQIIRERYLELDRVAVRARR